MHYLFAHGTLRQGCVNNGLMAGGALLGAAETSEEYALCLIDEKPVVTKRPLSTIKGEVYSVSDEMLIVLDRFNTHPRVNKRELVSVKLADGTGVEAWLYFYIQPMRNSVFIETGDYAGQKR
jgi:gamma-glutamylcyclotransferase (GGCT)/AIG2-like uncharacterized protein YtfP